MSNRRPLIYAHRGVWTSSPQNSKQAMAIASSKGADGIETDLRLTKDYEIVLCHDPDFYGSEIATSTLSSLRDRRQIEGELPTLADAFSGVDSIRINLELKDDSQQRNLHLVEVVKEAIFNMWKEDFVSKWIEISSFNLSICAHVGVLTPEIPRYLLLDRYQSVSSGLRRASELGVRGVNLESLRASPVNIRRANSMGLRVGVWTVDSPIRARMLSYPPVSHIITNRVEQLKTSFVLGGRSEPQSLG